MKLIVMFALFLSWPALADVMNLNNFMPTQLEDATPIDEKSLDIQYSLASEKMEKDVIVHRPNIRYGLNKHIQFEAQGNIESGGKEDQSGETEFNVLYRFNQSSNFFPEISLSPTIIFPTGKRMMGVDYGARLNFTSTLVGSSKTPVTQLHLNYQIIHNGQVFEKEKNERSFYAIGISHRLLEETAIILDISSNEDNLGTESYLAEAGIHQSLGHQIYLGASIGVGLGSSEIKQMGIVALEKQFN